MVALFTSICFSSEDSYCSGQTNSTLLLRSGCDHPVTELLSSRRIIAEEVNHFRETETLVAPTRYAAVASEEEHTSLRGDNSNQLCGDSAHFHVAAGKVRQSKPTRVVPTETQETGYCTATATQGEIPVLSSNGKLATYRKPCESETHLGQHGAIDTLTTTDRVARDDAASVDDNKTSGLADEGAGGHRAGSLFPHQSQSHTPQNSSSSSNSTLLSHTVLPDAPGGEIGKIDSSRSDGRLAHGPRVVEDSLTSRLSGPQLVTSVQATDDVDVPHPTDLVVAVARLPRSIARSMAVNVHSSHMRSLLEVGHMRISQSADKPADDSPRKNRLQRRVKSPNGTYPQAGCVLFSGVSVFEEGTFLPIPSQQAVERSIGKGGNGTISIVYFKGAEFAVKRTHLRQAELDILTSLHHDNILPLQAVLMGEEDPQRPSRHFCYHFMPRMSADLQSYLTKVGHGALSNLLMQHKEEPTMLQLVVDNTKHILRSTLKALAYLHRSYIVHNDVKPSNFLIAIHCGCDTPLTCNHGQNFAVKLADFDSAMDIKKLQTSQSSLKQLYRNTPSGTPGYRPPEYVLVATRTKDELDLERLTSADVWAFGCSVLKIFLSHSGPHSQKQMAFVHLWSTNVSPWKEQGESAREVLKIALLERVYPNWPQLWDFVAVCIKVDPTDRATCWKLSNHAFFTS